MLCRFKHPFGNFETDDEIELPDGDEFDHYYLEEVAGPGVEDK